MVDANGAIVMTGKPLVPASLEHKFAKQAALHANVHSRAPAVALMQQEQAGRIRPRRRAVRRRHADRAAHVAARRDQSV